MFGFNDVNLKETRFYQQALSEGEHIGHAKGRVAGRAEGEATLLLRLLDRRFGPLPDSVKQRISATDADTLLRWGERLLDAKSLEDIFR